MKCTCIDGWRRCAVCYGTGALCAICGDPVDEGGSCGKCPIAATRSSSSSAASSSATLWELLEDSRLFVPDHQERALVWDGPCGSIRLSFGPLGDLLRIDEDEDREETAASLLAAVAATVGAEDWRDVGWMVRELAQRGAIGRLAPLPRKLPGGKRAPRVVFSRALRAGGPWRASTPTALPEVRARGGRRPGATDVSPEGGIPCGVILPRVSRPFGRVVRSGRRRRSSGSRGRPSRAGSPSLGSTLGSHGRRAGSSRRA